MLQDIPSTSGCSNAGITLKNQKKRTRNRHDTVNNYIHCLENDDSSASEDFLGSDSDLDYSPDEEELSCSSENSSAEDQRELDDKKKPENRFDQSFPDVNEKENVTQQIGCSSETCGPVSQSDTNNQIETLSRTGIANDFPLQNIEHCAEENMTQVNIKKRKHFSVQEKTSKK